jgi:hypothetical protein
MDVTWDDEDPEQVEKVRALNITNDWMTVVDLDLPVGKRQSDTKQGSLS